MLNFDANGAGGGSSGANNATEHTKPQYLKVAMRVSPVKMLAVGAMCISLAFALNQISLFRMPLGGSVTPFSMMFIVLAGYWLGPVRGIAAGVAMGLLNASTGFIAYHPMSFVLDYVLAFGALGLAGFFRKWRFGLQIGFVVGVFGRFLMVFLSGFLFFGMYAPEGQHAAVYSAIYNMSYIAPEMIASLVLISLPAVKHAIDAVTKTVVSPADYTVIHAANAGSVSANARLVTGAVMGALGGFAFVVAGYITRLENLTITMLSTDALPFADPPRADRLYRLVERNTQHLFTLHTVGVVFLAVAVALLLSVLKPKEEVGRANKET
ncbi:MAG: energy-coupled thiamine transporter ThiT [Defluviitaleaceae bacterium]|nr:energy-coupled thiamine transporter ThiT [Defluviitaleaceae bacterium]